MVYEQKLSKHTKKKKRKNIQNNFYVGIKLMQCRVNDGFLNLGPQGGSLVCVIPQ